MEDILKLKSGLCEVIEFVINCIRYDEIGLIPCEPLVCVSSGIGSIDHDGCHIHYSWCTLHLSRKSTVDVNILQKITRVL